MSYHPWAIFLPEKVSSLYMNDLQASSSEIYLVQDGAYDDAHQERMELTEAYGEVTDVYKRQGWKIRLRGSDACGTVRRALSDECVPVSKRRSASQRTEGSGADLRNCQCAVPCGIEQS